MSKLATTHPNVSVDTPFALNEFRDQEDLSFGLVSDTDKEIIDAYDVEMDFEALGYYGLAKRAVFVVDENGEVAYDWVSDDPGVEPTTKRSRTRSPTWPSKSHV